MPRNGVLILAVASLVFTSSLFSQTQQDPTVQPRTPIQATKAQTAIDSGENVHAPDFGTREMIYSIFISPLANAPFKTTLNTQWTRTLKDGTTVTLQNHRIIMRDSAGRIFQERSSLVPSGKQTGVMRFELSDPVKHVKYFCNPYNPTCHVQGYFVPATVVISRNAQQREAGFTSESLGRRSVAGLEVVGTRETKSIPAGTMGNSQPLKITNEYWFSPQLGINLLVKRDDPRHGTQDFEVQDMTLGEPEAAFFSVPQGYTVIGQTKK